MTGSQASTRTRRSVITLLSVIALTWGSPALAAPIASYQRLDDGASFQTDEGALRVTVMSDRVIRVVRGPDSTATPPPSLVVTATPARTPFRLATSDDAITLTTSAVSVSVARASGEITFANAGGTSYLTEGDGGGASFHPTGGSYAVRQAFSNPPTYDGTPIEAFFGLGQHQSGLMNLRGATVRLQQINGDVGLPFVLSSKGYGLLWDNASVATVRVASPGSGGIVFESEAGPVSDYYFIAGPRPDDVIAGYRALTGATPMLPRWAWGFWQSKERYQTQEELLDVARQYRAMGVPIDAVVQDWQYWEPGQWGSHRFEAARFPDPHAMVDALHDMNIHAIVSVWPRFDLDTDTGAELDSAGVLYPPVFTNVYPPGRGRWYDAFSARGRELYWRQISERLGAQGWDGYWLDASEAELGGDWGEMRTQPTALGPGANVFNAYPLLHVRGVYEGQRRDFPHKRALLLTRSAWAGQQRYGAITWSGDIHADWETFRRQIPAGLNFTASGVPYWNTDIGGFFGSDPSDPAYRELFIRWFEFGAFNPMFRVHGTNRPKELWRFDAEAQQMLRAAIEQRYRLLPYIYATSWRVTADSYTMMRPLVMDFSNDPVALSVIDQFMFGPSLLISPVTQPGAASRNVYLPSGQAWYDYVTNRRHAGGTTVAANAPLGRLPIFVRAGSILPLGPVVQYANEAPNAPIELRVYRGANGAFTLYDDAGDGYGYERGERALVELAWDDTRGVLTFGARAGRFPGMATERSFNVVFIDAAGVSAPQTINYRGRRILVSPR